MATSTVFPKKGKMLVLYNLSTVLSLFTKLIILLFLTPVYFNAASNDVTVEITNPTYSVRKTSDRSDMGDK
jgi:hypothetical protein